MKQDEIQHTLNNKATIIIESAEAFKKYHELAQTEERKPGCQNAVDCLTAMQDGILEYLHALSFEFKLAHGVMGQNDINLEPLD